MMRLRIAFEKTEAMRFTGHLDLHKTWERTIRRASLQLAYSQGFHPQPRINLACALPLGFTSVCEWVDIWLESEIALSEVTSALEAAQPPGIRIQSIQRIDLGSPSLQTQVHTVDYLITLLDPVQGLDERIQDLMQKSHEIRARRGKTYDLRPLIEDLIRLPDDHSGLQCLHTRLSAREGATGRPEELVAALGIDKNCARYHRIAMNWKKNS
jgi:radical SAM-linked protein